MIYKFRHIYSHIFFHMLLKLDKLWWRTFFCVFFLLKCKLRYKRFYRLGIGFARPGPFSQSHSPARNNGRARRGGQPGLKDSPLRRRPPAAVLSFEMSDSGLPRKEASVLKGHEGAVLAARFNGDGNYCLSCGKDRTIRLWNPHRGIHIKTYKSHGREVRDVHCTS